MKQFGVMYLLFCFDILCAQEQLVLKSELIPGNDTIWVFKPESGDVSESFPAIYLLHGMGGKYSSWNDLVNLQDYANTYRFIIICPDGFSDSYYLDSPIDSQSQFESFFVKILYPKILEIYPINKSKVFITGLSMGGSGAMYIFLRHSELFLSAGSTSGLMDLSYSHNKYSSLSRLLGAYDTNKEVFYRFSPISLLENIKGSDKHIFFDCGTEDYLYECNNAFRNRCDKLKIKATYVSRPGKHQHEYWKKSIHCHFEFFKSFTEQ